MQDPLDEAFDELLHYLDTFDKEAKAYIDAKEQNPTHLGTSPVDPASFIQAEDEMLRYLAGFFQAEADELRKITDEILASDTSPILELEEDDWDDDKDINLEDMNRDLAVADLGPGKTVDQLVEELDLFLKSTEEELGMTALSDQSTADNTDDENKVPFYEAFVEKIDKELMAAEEAALSSTPIKWPEEEDDEDLDPNINEQDMKDFMDKELSLRLAQATSLLQASTVKPLVTELAKTLPETEEQKATHFGTGSPVDPAVADLETGKTVEKPAEEQNLSSTQVAPPPEASPVKSDDTEVQGHLESLFLDFDTALVALETKAQALGARNYSKDSTETLMLCENLSNLKEAFLKEPTQGNLKVFSDMCEKLIVDAQTSRINSHRGNNPISWIQSLAGEDTDTMKKVRELKKALGKIKLSEPDAKPVSEEQLTVVPHTIKK